MPQADFFLDSAPVLRYDQPVRLSRFSRGTIMASIKELHVNGARHRLDADEQRSLLSVLRDDLDLTGSKYGCGEGRCGACTVLIDGKATRSCVTAAGDCQD